MCGGQVVSCDGHHRYCQGRGHQATQPLGATEAPRQRRGRLQSQELTGRQRTEPKPGHTAWCGIWWQGLNHYSQHNSGEKRSCHTHSQLWQDDEGPVLRKENLKAMGTSVVTSERQTGRTGTWGEREAEPFTPAGTQDWSPTEARGFGTRSRVWTFRLMYRSQRHPGAAKASWPELQGSAGAICPSGALQKASLPQSLPHSGLRILFTAY